VFAWNLKSNQVTNWSGARNANLHSMALSPDGETLALGVARSGVELWDIEARELKSVLKGHAGEIYDIDFAPNGRAIVSGGLDETVRIWRTSNPQ
jgi:WD40 repeat protein